MLKPPFAQGRIGEQLNWMIDPGTYVYYYYCMRSLAHLQATLPMLAAQSGCTCVIVECSCPGEGGRSVEHAFLTVRVEGRSRFNLGEARMAGA